MSPNITTTGMIPANQWFDCMNPLGIFQLVSVALEGVAHVINPKLRKQDKKKNAFAFGLVYIAILLGGVLIILAVLRSLYIQK